MTAGTRGESSYRVVGLIAAGGTAEVYHAQVDGLAGFSKHVAIKRVLPHLVENEKFIRMLLDEARLSARLNHRNIVQVFDVGRDRETYFIVMEYVDGTTLADLIDHARARGSRLAVPIALHVAIEVCNALQYAHELTDETGRPLGVVHRDVSPANVLVSRGGDVKLADFGMAKAESQVEKTDPGVVKGKLAYLAPEITHGAEPDARADQFATGVVLWEMLASRRLFRGENDRETLARVRAASVPSLTDANPDVPEALERVVRRALALDPSARFATMEAMGRALREVQFGLQLPLNPQDLGRLVREVGNVASGAAPPGPGESVNSVLVAASRSSTTPPPPLPAPRARVPASLERAHAAGPATLVIQSIVTPSPDDTLTAARTVVAPAPALPDAHRGEASALIRMQRQLGIRRGRGPWIAAALLALGAVGLLTAAAFHRLPRGLEAALASHATPDAGVATAPDAGLEAMPSAEARTRLRQQIQRRIDLCAIRAPGRPLRRVRVGIVYDGATGRASEVRVPGNAGPSGQCIEPCVRAQSTPPFATPSWSTDLDFTLP